MTSLDIAIKQKAQAEHECDLAAGEFLTTSEENVAKARERLRVARISVQEATARVVRELSESR